MKGNTTNKFLVVTEDRMAPGKKPDDLAATIDSMTLKIAKLEAQAEATERKYKEEKKELEREVNLLRNSAGQMPPMGMNMGFGMPPMSMGMPPMGFGMPQMGGAMPQAAAGNPMQMMMTMAASINWSGPAGVPVETSCVVCTNVSRCRVSTFWRCVVHTPCATTQTMFPKKSRFCCPPQPCSSAPRRIIVCGPVRGRRCDKSRMTPKA